MADDMSGDGAGAPGRVLLIEDEPNIATAIAFILGRDGWRVSTHSDGATALDAVARHAPDVVVLDVMLPGKSGFDVLGGIRGGPRPDLPVLMLTAKGQRHDRERAEALGASGFMTKPFSNRELLEAVRRLAPGPASGAGGGGSGREAGSGGSRRVGAGEDDAVGGSGGGPEAGDGGIAASGAVPPGTGPVDGT